jgi:hypothetical protein
VFNTLSRLSHKEPQQTPAMSIYVRRELMSVPPIIEGQEQQQKQHHHPLQGNAVETVGCSSC